MLRVLGSQVSDEDRYRNLAAVAILRSATGFAEPEFLQFEATLPRPAAWPFYELDTPGSDEEVDIAGTDGSSMEGGSEAGDGDDPMGMEVGSHLKIEGWGV